MGGQSPAICHDRGSRAGEEDKSGSFGSYLLIWAAPEASKDNRRATVAEKSELRCIHSVHHIVLTLNTGGRPSPPSRLP